MRIKWQIISEDKQDKSTKWRAEINSERFGKYAWIELIALQPKGKEYIVSIQKLHSRLRNSRWRMELRDLGWTTARVGG